VIASIATVQGDIAGTPRGGNVESQHREHPTRRAFQNALRICPRKQRNGPMNSATLSVTISLFTLLGGCSLTSIGAKDRAHSEEAALHKLLDGQKSYSFVVQNGSVNVAPPVRTIHGQSVE
jgi:hypothetical protein